MYRSRCQHCLNDILLTDRGWAEDTTYLHTTPEESADMARQCGLNPEGTHEPMLRPLTRYETDQHTSGHIVFTGAVETEEGVMVPVPFGHPARTLDPTRNRPNLNPVLDHMRDYDDGDPWGTGMMFGFAVCEALTYLGAAELIPSGLGYSSSMFGVDQDDSTFQTVLDLTTSRGMIDDFVPATVDELVTAARCLDHYLNLCKLAGKDY